MPEQLSFWRVFLRPGWIALAAVVVIFSVACFKVLAPWQLGKHTHTEHRNELTSRALAAPPAPISELLLAGVTTASNWRTATAVGTYESDRQLLLRERPVNGTAEGPQVLTPFRLDNGTTILVDRGFLPQGQTTAPPAPQGQVQLTARLRLPETTPANREVRTLDGSVLEVPAIDPAVVGGLLAAPLVPAYLQLSPGQPGELGALEEPDLDPGPYLSYGLQWLAFGVIAVLALGYFGYAELRERRGPAAPKPEPTSGSANETRTSRSERRRQLRTALAGLSEDVSVASRLVDRYGR